MPASVSVAPGSTLTLDYTSINSTDRLPNNGLLVLNNSSLVVNENNLSATTETLVMRSQSGTVRRIQAVHNFEKLAHYANLSGI